MFQNNSFPNNAPRPDGVYPKELKELTVQLAEPLAFIFEKSLREGVFPSDWKEAQVTPLFKKGEKSSPRNYPPVT